MTKPFDLNDPRPIWEQGLSSGVSPSSSATEIALRLLQASSCFRPGAACGSLPCACAQSLVDALSPQAQAGCTCPFDGCAPCPVCAAQAGGAAQPPTIPIAREAAEPTQYLIDQFREHGSKPSAQAVQVPCPVCGGEAIHALDVLKRTVIHAPIRWDANENRSYEPVETLAAEIYDGFVYDGPAGTTKPKWTPGGNGLKQDEARYEARRRLRIAGHSPALPSTVLSTPEDREPDAWEWRACIGGRWGAWLYLDQPLARFQERNAFNLDNGTYELRALYAVTSATRVSPCDPNDPRSIWEQGLGAPSTEGK